MKILVTGANGQLGNEMRAIARHSRHSFVFSDVVGDDIIPLDITDAQAVSAAVREHGVDCIVNCAAYTNVDKAETDQALCHKLNAEAPALLAQAMAEAGGLLVHISTDYVFGGDPYNTPCREEQTGTPTGVYGATKLAGEKAIIASEARHIIIRTAWLYSEYGKNFVKTMLALTASKPQIKVVFDQVGTPTYALDLARAILRILDCEEHHPTAGGLYHYSNEGVCSWYDFAKAIGQLSGHDACDVQPCHSSEFPSPVQRPAYSVLDKSKIKLTYGVEVPYWTDSLKTCLTNLNALK